MSRIIEYKEDSSIIDQLLNKISINIENIKKKINAHESLIFTIGNTAFSEANNIPYITPIRKSKDVYTFGVIVYTQFQARIISKKVDGKVDYIFVDCEKKLPGIINPDYSLEEKYNLEGSKNNINSLEYGNISKSCINSAAKSFSIKLGSVR